MPKSKKRHPGKPQGMNLAQAKAHREAVFDELVRAEAWKLFLHWSDNLQQEIIDAAFMAANDLFGMGPGRCEAFGQRIIEYRDEIAKLINLDYEDDQELVYAREKIDRRLRQICGDKFEPWEVRYGTEDSN